ncbi:uncharacterized protein N7496_005214 [Penicillium cataractarum]|uniref:Uncharacterized protein n=1 Tax=Penicillium cataractarum TaxID=2100454 RepID=A0A9W9SGV8_9EURO|nr:uncharacterized protein N7496_005214 [Penicillium cataractarum]KAJ5377805.1 hypothetical protein N7496_005214 [Penicillium cataractarum]
MSGFNPFRARNPDSSSAGATASLPIPDNASLDLFSKPAPSVPTQLPNGYPKKPALSLELETDDSTSTDEQSVDPFNPDPSVSDIDNDLGYDDNTQRRSSTSSALNDRPREFFGSAPHPAPSADGSTTTPSFNLPFVPATQTMRSGSETGLTSDSSSPQENVPMPVTRDGGQTQTSRSPPELGTSTSPSSRSNKEKKPPPPPRSHHGKRISTATNTTASTSVNAASSSSHTSPPRSTNRLPYHASSPESQISARRSGTPNASSTSQAPGSDYFTFSVSSEDQQRARAPDPTYPGESVHRSTSQHSQHKRPPTPPLSRRHSQMRRSKSIQSKSSGSRLTMSSRDSESTDSSQPPSPGPSTRSLASSIPDRKRLSMPPPASRSREREVELRAVPGHSLPPDSLSPPPSTSRSNPPPPGRLYCPVARPPPWHLHPRRLPRRARDSGSRSSEGRPVSQVMGMEETPLPQPSNAQDILADLSRLQKEVDDLRGHYESRKVSQ